VFSVVRILKTLTTENTGFHGGRHRGRRDYAAIPQT
jgi:hypothetical protein